MSDNHLTLLGSQSSFFTSPDDARLESFPNRGTRPYTITLDTHEFSSLCPVTGQPDSCHLTITYVPAEKLGVLEGDDRAVQRLDHGGAVAQGGDAAPVAVAFNHVALAQATQH